MIHILRVPATQAQIEEMLEVQETYIKVAVDVELGVLAGGGEFHADCESVLVGEGSRKANIWGADWVPDRREVRFHSLINIRPPANRSMEIRDPQIQQRVEAITKRLFGN